MKVKNNFLQYNQYSKQPQSFKGQDFKVSSNDYDDFGEVRNIHGQDMCWKLYKPEVFEQFIKSDKELLEPVEKLMNAAHVYNIDFSIELLSEHKGKNPAIDKFYDIVKSKYDIDLTEPPRVYRFIGKSEVDALRRDGKVSPQRGYWDNIDVTINPNLNWNQYRVTFKPKKEFSVLDKDSKIEKNRGEHHDYYYLHKGPYTIDDVEKIEQMRF